MTIKDNMYVEIEYKLSLDSGEVIDQSREGAPFGFIVGAGQVIAGLEKGLQGMKAGDTAVIKVSPEDGYGNMNPALLRDIPKSHFPENYELVPGAEFEAQGPHGPLRFRIHELKDEVVVADFNHPLAGKTLNFDITVATVREPTVAEMSACAPSCDCSTNDNGNCGGCSGGTCN